MAFGLTAAQVGMVGIGAGLLGGAMSSNSARDAAQTQADASNRAADLQAQTLDKQLNLQREMFNKQVDLQEPFRQAGLTSQNRLLDMLGLSGNTTAPGYGSMMKDFGASDFQADPGYQWRMDQGQRALERSAAARGGLLSGAAMKAATDYGQNQASAEYTNAFNRFQTNRANKLNPLQSLMGASQTAANNQAQAAGNFGNSAGNAYGAYGSNVGNLMTNMGNAQAASRIAQGNAWTSAVNNGWNAYQQGQLMNKLFPSPGYSGSTGYTGGADPMGDFITSNGWAG